MVVKGKPLFYHLLRSVSVTIFVLFVFLICMVQKFFGEKQEWWSQFSGRKIVIHTSKNQAALLLSPIYFVLCLNLNQQIAVSPLLLHI